MHTSSVELVYVLLDDFPSEHLNYALQNLMQIQNKRSHPHSASRFCLFVFFLKFLNLFEQRNFKPDLLAHTLHETHTIYSKLFYLIQIYFIFF